MKKALLVGINYRGTPNELNGCINDVINMRNFLIKRLKYHPNNILLLTDDTEQKPTKENIINSLNWLISGNGRKSRLFFHFSGHGTYIRDSNNDEKDGNDECIVPLDFQINGFIVDDNLKGIFNQINKGAKLTCVFDCCNSGTVADLRYNFYLRGGKLVHQNNSRNNTTRGNIVCLSACLDHQLALDAFENRTYQGAMTYSLLTVLGRRYKNGRNNFRNIINELSRFMRRKSYTQIPQLSFGRNVNLRSRFNIL